MTVFATADAHFATLDRTIPSQADYELALRHAPLIRFDIREPFLPLVVGYTVFREPAASPSFPREIALPEGATCAIEYAVWWDWEIQHLYELEHIWVYVDADEHVVAADASWHAGYHAMVDDTNCPPLQDGRVILYSESGKHAFAPVKDWLLERAPKTNDSCGRNAGKMGVLVTKLFEGIIGDRTPLNNNVTHAYMERLAFEPSYDFSNIFDLRNAAFVPWPTLFAWIPTRVKWWADHLRETTPPEARRVLRIAHRGASAYAQEGSSSSIQKAAELGSDMVEVDIRMTADGVPVIAHDADLKRVFGVDALISDLTLDELNALVPPDREPILTFEAMAALCRELNLGLYLDIKDINAAGMQLVVESLRRHNLMSYSIFGSFRPDFLAEIKHSTPDAVTSILFASPHVDPVALAQAVSADYVHPCFERFEQPHTLIDGEWMKRVRGAGLGVVCWHEERPPEIAALQRLGVDGICSDMPELLVPRK